MTILGGRHYLFAGTIGAAAAVWLVILSGWFNVNAGSIMTRRQNVLFDSDMNLWLDRIIGSAKSPEQTVHPLEIVFWKRPARGIARVLKFFVPAEQADVLGARILVACIAGSGVGSLALFALYLGAPPLNCLLLFCIYLLFTSNVTICLPEHFGISNGLLTLTFVVTAMVLQRKVKLALQAVLGVLCGGTSILNVLFPALCIFDTYFKSVRLKVRLLLVTVPLGIAAAVTSYLLSPSIQRYFNLFATFRWFRHPLLAIVYSIYFFVLPAVGPSPGVMRIPHWDMVSYEPRYKPLELGYYFGLQGLGAIAWLVLFARSAYLACRDGLTLPYARLLFGWLIFNVVFYNFWGRELFLWAPAWSWALMAVVILGARRLSWKFVAAAALPIVASQIYTLFEIKQAFLTITE